MGLPLARGLSRVFLRNGEIRDHSCGYMVNVRGDSDCNLTYIDGWLPLYHDNVAGSGKSVLWYVPRQSCHPSVIEIINQLHNH
jgi:hypothetical protein